MPVVLPELGALAVLFCALAILLLAHQISAAFFGAATGLVDNTVGHIWWLGGKISHGLHAIEERVNNFLSPAITATEGAIAATWHALASSIEFVGETLVHIASATWRVAWYVDTKYPLRVLWALIHRLTRGEPRRVKIEADTRAKAQAASKAISNTRGGAIATHVKIATKGIEGEIAALRDWTLPRIGALEGEIGGVIELDLPRLRARDRTITDRLDSLWHRLRAHGATIAGTAAIALVGTALARLGGSWIRCGNWRNAGRAVCRMDAGLLEDLLAGTLLVVGGISIVTFTRELQAIMGEAESGIRGFVRETR